MTDGPLLIPVLGDQLTPDIAALRAAHRDDSIVLMMEVADETAYVKHHKAKIPHLANFDPAPKHSTRTRRWSCHCYVDGRGAGVARR